MSETGDMLIEATTRLFEEKIDEAAARRARAGEWLAEAWAAVEGMGLPLALVPEDAGGFGIPAREALALVRLVGRFAAPLPIAETMLANSALAAAGLPLAEGPAAFVPAAASLTIADGRLSGTAARVPWGRVARTLVVEVDGTIVRLGSGWNVAEEGSNLAAMPRDTLAIDAGADAAGVLYGPGLLLRAAAIRALQIAGALETLLDLTVAHVNERVQFGRPLAKFQAVQHELAKVAGEVAAASAAADMAADALAGPAEAALVPIAAARVRTGEAAGVAVGICHQLHGAIGFTAEHRLHLFTTALWGWRDEYGGQPHWSRIVGDAAFAAGADGYWPFVVAA